MKVAVTGSTSVIGRRLIAKLLEAGHTPVPFGGSKSSIWQIGQPCPTNLNFDAMVHLAHDRSKSVKENVESTKILCNSFAGPKILLSSFSAHSKSVSKYGQSKYLMESIFSNSNGTSLRAGLVYGDKVEGIFAQIEFLIRKFPIVPLPYRGASILFTTHIDDLIAEIVWKLGNFESLTTFAAHPMPISFRHLSFEIQKNLGIKRKTFKVWRQPLDVLMKFTAKFAPNFPFVDSLLSLSCQATYEEISKLKIPNSIFREFKIND